MRINEPVTNRQRDYRDDQKIVSTTDSKGLITDVNQDFVEISGFTRDELIGQAHNMVRHPWMPQAAFAELWQHNKSNKPWMGMVKNRCKNGDHYWVDAFVTSMLEDGQSVGYQSVRQKPKQEWIDRATDFYENKFNPIDQLLSLWQGRSLAVKFFVAFSLVTVFCGLLWWMNMPPAMVVAAALLGNGIFSFLLAKPWSDYAREMESVFKSDIAKKIYTGRSDELGQVQLIHKFFQSQQDTILYRSSNVAEDVKARAFAAYNESKKTTNEIDLMYEQVESVSSAINEMSETVHAVADNAGATSSAADESKQGVTTGKNILMDAKKAMDDLVNAVDKSAVIIQRLSEDSAQIGSVVDVINGIAEQTNLLALNAAIEAARAGEQGRGFAVVADEVRALAAKTQESTGQISEMISTLQGGAAEAVNSIATSHSQVNISVESIDNLEKHFATILENVDKITDMCVSTASATEQQSAVAENINNNIVKINQTGKNTMASMQGVNKNNEALEKISEKMNVMIEQFKFN